jgi:hypothetical protein
MREALSYHPAVNIFLLCDDPISKAAIFLFDVQPHPHYTTAKSKAPHTRTHAYERDRFERLSGVIVKPQLHSTSQRYYLPVLIASSHAQSADIPYPREN